MKHGQFCCDLNILVKLFKIIAKEDVKGWYNLESKENG